MGKILVGVGTVNWGLNPPPPNPPVIPTLRVILPFTAHELWKWQYLGILRLASVRYSQPYSQSGSSDVASGYDVHSNVFISGADP